VYVVISRLLKALTKITLSYLCTIRVNNKNRVLKKNNQWNVSSKFNNFVVNYVNDWLVRIFRQPVETC